MENDQIVYSRNKLDNNTQNNPGTINEIAIEKENKEEGSKEVLTAQENKVVAQTFQMTSFLILDPLPLDQTLQQIQQMMLNIRTIKFLEILGGYNKIIIRCHVTNCVACFCRPARSHEVIGINANGEEHLLMTASQEQIKCDSYGYMLVYRAFNNAIIGALGYQNNPLMTCCVCGGSGCCCGECCSGCCSNCCCCCCCPCDCSCCTNCCSNGGCCVGGCCLEGCCCCCEDGCCVGGICNCCGCCCFHGGCCVEPICPKGCCACPNFQKPLLDFRILNTLEEALNTKAGLYVSTLYSPVDCCGCYYKKFGYKKCGERFALENVCCACAGVQLEILDLLTNRVAGVAKQFKNICCAVESYDVELPKEAFPLEKLLIISEIFMFVYEKWDESRKDKKIITRKRKIFPGLKPDFM